MKQNLDNFDPGDVMGRPMDLIDFAEKFIASEISEDEYVNKHDTSQRKINSWYEIQTIVKDKQKWTNLLRKIKQAGNRRRILFESIDVGVNDLSRMIQQWGNSTIQDLIKSSNQKGGTSNRNFDSKFLAQFGIITRATYQLIRFKNVNFKWNDTLFNLIEDDAINGEELVNKINDVNIKRNRFLMGYFLKIQGLDVYIRFERREGMVIIEVMNPEIRSFRILVDLLINTPFDWNYFFTPTIYDNKEFLVFVGNAETNDMEYLLSKEFVWVNNWYHLQSPSTMSNLIK